MHTSGPTNRVSPVPPETEVRAPCPVGPNESVHTSVLRVRYEVVFATSGCLHPSLLSPHRMSCSSRFATDGTRVPSCAPSCASPSCAFLRVAHRAHRRFASKQSTKVEADVRGTHAVAVLSAACSPHLGRCASPESWSSSATTAEADRGPLPQLPPGPRQHACFGDGRVVVGRRRRAVDPFVKRRAEKHLQIPPPRRPFAGRRHLTKKSRQNSDISLRGDITTNVATAFWQKSARGCRGRAPHIPDGRLQVDAVLRRKSCPHSDISRRSDTSPGRL